MKKTKPPHYWHEAKKFLSKKDKNWQKLLISMMDIWLQEMIHFIHYVDRL